MMKKILLLIAAIACTAANAQLKELTLSDAVLKAGTDLAPKRLSGLQWITGTSTYSYAKGDSLMMGTLGKSGDVVLMRLEELNAQLPEGDRGKRWPAIEWTNADRFRFFHGHAMSNYDRKSKKLATVFTFPEEAANHDLSPTGAHAAFTVGQNLHVIASGATSSTAITHDSIDGLVNGVSVHRQEYGIVKGTFWDPTGRRLAYYHMDESMVTTYDLEDISTQPSTFTPIRYPMAGQTSHHVSVMVYDTKSGTTARLNTGEPLDQYLTNISWDATGEYVHITHLDRKTENLKLVRYNASTGAAERTLIEEHDDKYLEPEHPAHFLKGDPNKYIWWSERDGWTHLYLYDVNGGLIRQLTRGRWLVKELIGNDPKEAALFIEGTMESAAGSAAGAMETQLYRVEIASGKTTRLSKDPGTHHGALTADGRVLLDTWSSLSVPYRNDAIDARDGRRLKTIHSSADPLSAYIHGTIEFLTVAGENGAPLNARLIKPSDFDSRTKYPVLIYVYNGPHVQLVTNSFMGGASAWMLHAAERGYLVFTLDGHGSENLGRDMEQVIHRQLGLVEVKDQMRGVDYLKSLPYADADRIGVHGWSYGGHMTTAMLLRAPGIFKVGVAGGPVMDWALYEVMYTERYMDTPAENPDGYALTRHTDKAENLKGDLLVIEGGNDDTVVPQHSYSFLKDCVGKGVQVGYFEYPGHGHNVRGKDRLHLMTMVLQRMDAALKP